MKQILCWMVLSGCGLAAAAVTGVPVAVSPGDGERITPIEAAEALVLLGRFLGEGGTLEELTGSQAWARALAVAQVARVSRGEPGAGAGVGGSTRAEAAPGAAAERAETATGGPRSASRAIQEIQHLGLKVEIEEGNNSASVAVQGSFKSSTNSDEVVGLLGVAMPYTGFDDFLTPYLQWLGEDEIGVLGFSLNSSTDNWGVVGVGGGDAWGGRFLNSDGAGVAVHQVMLAGPDWAIDTRGDVRIREGSLACPANTFAVGSWCILGSKQTPRSFGNALRHCWDLGLRLCPLDAIMACDHLEPGGGADCTGETDPDDAGDPIWLGDLPHPFEQVDETLVIDEVLVDPTNPWAGSRGWVYEPAAPPEIDKLNDRDKSTTLASFCCTTPR